MESARKIAAPRNPEVARMRRLWAKPARCANRAEMEPQNSAPNPPKNNGRMAYRAASDGASFQCCCRYVGSQVMLKYQGNDEQKYCSHSSQIERDLSSLAQGTLAWPEGRRSPPSSSASSAAFTAGWSRGLSRYQR